MYTHIEDNIYTIPVPLPNNPLRQLNSYVIKGEGRNLVIDTGFKLEECRKALCDGLEELGVDMNCTDIFLTHMHSDHTGLAAELATPDSLPDAATLSCGPFDQLAASATIAPRDAVVVLTHGHVHDETVLLAVLSRDAQPAYVGCIGSRRKSDLARERLLAAGVPVERVDAVHMPIGEDILAVTPAEIAVSIVAQLIRCRAERRETQR